MVWKKSDKPPKSQAEIRDEINQKIIAALEGGKLPFWNRPWTVTGSGCHTNAVSMKRYRGVNPMILELAAMDANYSSTYWASYKQWNDLGGRVKRGETATMIVFWRMFTPENQPVKFDKKGKKKPPETIPLLRFWPLFNVEQVDPAPNGKPSERILKLIAPPVPVTTGKKSDDGADFTIARHIMQACKDDGQIVKHAGDRAFWTDSTENITMPPQSRFKTNADYWLTYLHEASHWTELSRHTNWDRHTHGYAMGELRAELSAIYLAQAARIPRAESQDALNNHASYLKSWLEKMKGDNRWIFSACKFADEAANCILKIANMQEADSEEEGEAAPAKPPAKRTRKKPTAHAA